MTLDRQKLRRDAQETVSVLMAGGYDGPDGWVDLSEKLDALAHNTRLYLPKELAELNAHFAPGSFETHLSVTRETTLQAAQRLLSEGTNKVAVLNFASATSPGGGFLTGSAAQEESIARASGLYRALTTFPAYYTVHQTQSDCLYTDRMMFSPDVPVFRDEEGVYLAQTYAIDVLTAAAPNLRGQSPAELASIQPQARLVIERRADLLLSVFRAAGSTRLVLGAWGCGAFRNDPAHVAATFHQLLTQGHHRSAFEEVVFAVFAMPWEETNLRAFQEQFRS